MRAIRPHAGSARARILQGVATGDGAGVAGLCAPRFATYAPALTHLAARTAGVARQQLDDLVLSWLHQNPQWPVGILS